MKIVKYHSGNVTNFEVYNLLINDEKDRTHDKYRSKDMNFIEKRVTKNIRLNSNIPALKPENIQSFLSHIETYGLTEYEKLQFLNLCPSTLVEIYLVIEHCEERFGQDGANALLELSLNTLWNA